ncbi:ADP-ribosylglycohydrolase [Pseudoalteromonas rubra]|uniref:ADP-ribosylglycohydrolase n=1 Tax=Pseudoalteromonas rubra TaxID=43658 RepID=A0A5S3WI14_9GAMM|nr:ADP-ribosylglycohydrolase family protein [Pseudoalteromonas rubra]TMP25942.1 ADP-ribosylglycohydrolase [Pseudoalteromonas rubra]TMP29801.1 ADP-ribosylglycohydrolase [Pseudoalteromonas rubra]
MQGQRDNLQDRVIGSLVGLACGDAVGTTLEFATKGTFKPLTDMIGGGPFNLNKGQWTDDTSMALCLAHSLLEKQGFDAKDQMERYCKWHNHGYMSSTGTCFDIGMTVSRALRQYQITNIPFSGATDKYSSGNGSIMRLAPIPIYYFSDISTCMLYAQESSRTTHGSPLCLDACRLFSFLIHKAFTSQCKNDIFEQIPGHFCSELDPVTTFHFKELDYSMLTGSGYVIDSLISALWCFYHSNDFKESILLAANIGNDADTTAAICGQIAGAFYGYNGIPVDWRESITMAPDIKQLALDLYQAGIYALKITTPPQ